MAVADFTDMAEDTDLHIGPWSERAERPGPLKRLRLTGLALVEALLMVPALALWVLSVLSLALTPVFGAGLLLAQVAVPATERLTRLHRELAGAVLGEELGVEYAEGSGLVRGPAAWVRDRARWRDFWFLLFSATGGLVLSALPVGLLTALPVYLVMLLFDTSGLWALLTLQGPVALALWWLFGPALVRLRALADRELLTRRTQELERRIETVTASRSATLDHSAAEIQRIERDLHDGAQARIAGAGMSIGLAEKLLGSDPAAAADLLREARETTMSALEDLRSVVRGIRPPVLADRGLGGAVEALAVALPVPVTSTVDLPYQLPAPAEAAAYFAVAECLANTAKHADATRAWVGVSHDGRVLRLVAGDDGRGGADPAGSGLAGVRRRLAAFDGTMVVDSPAGGPTVVTMELPCESSSPRTRPSSASG